MDMKRFVGQIVVITGGASGFGKECASRFAREGANIASLDLNDTANKALASECRNLGAEAMAIHCDVADPESVKSAFIQVKEQWGRIDVMVASAGIYSCSALPDVTFKRWQRMLDVNLTGVFLCDQAVAPVMMEQRSGSIINISSMAGKTSWTWSVEYSAAKTGVIGLTRSVAMELAPFGVTVNAICPSIARTPMLHILTEGAGRLRDGKEPEEWLKGIADACPMKRLLEPWEVAGLVSFLASKDSRYITGQAIELDGGQIMS